MEVPARRVGDGDNAFLDWLNFTTDETDFFFGKGCLSDEDVIDRVSHYCKEIYGFGVTMKRPTGANFYRDSYVLGDNYGVVCHGGQRSTVLVMLSGEGCAAAREGWEKRLYEFLTKRCGARAKITRADLAHDVYDGIAYNVDRADADFDSRLFNCGGRNPNHEQRGNWKHPSGKGRTLYIGNRESGKFLRVYEKGRQLGDKNSEWVRVEVEMKSVNRIIPFEVLLHPGEYLSASYPALSWICQRQERILSTQKKTEISYAAGCKWLQKQVGAWINVLVEIEGSAEKAVQKIIKEGAMPSRLKIPDWKFAGESIHEIERVKPNFEVFFQASMA
jgi:phage replication initiation protein